MSKGYNIKNSCCLLCYCAPFSVFQTARVNCTTRLNFALPILLFIIELHKMEVGGIEPPSEIDARMSSTCVAVSLFSPLTLPDSGPRQVPASILFVRL